MSINLRMNIVPEWIDAGKWAEAFQNTLKILEAGQLANYQKKKIHGSVVNCIVPSKRIPVGYEESYEESVTENENTTYRWVVDGDMLTGCNMDTFRLYEDLGHYHMLYPARITRRLEKRNLPYDLLFMNLFQEDAEEFGVDGIPSCPIWAGDTNGNRGHVYLLAVACLLCAYFPEAVTVYGDITYGQCFRAVEIVKEATGREIQIPVQFRREALVQRLRDDKVEEKSLLPLFLRLYRGPKEGLADYLKSQFATEEVYRQIAKYMKYSNENTALKQLFKEGFPLQDIFQILVKEEDGPKYRVEEIIKALILGRVHVKQKEVYDVTEVREFEPEPDSMEITIVRQMAKMAGLVNPNIDAFIPIQKMIWETRKAFPDRDDIVNTYAWFLDTIDTGIHVEAKSRNMQDNIYNIVHEKVKEKEADAEKYDVMEWNDLYFWKPDQQIHPKVHNILLNAVQNIHDFVQTKKPQYCDGKSKEEREFIFLSQNSPNHLIPEDTWNWLMDNLMDDDIYMNYLGMMSINVYYNDGKDLYDVLSLNKALFDYYRSLVKA